MSTPKQPASGAVQNALAALEQIGPALRAEYGRGAHRGRLEQIEQHLTGLASLIGQLPDEEDREGDYAGRLVQMHKDGKIDPEPPDGVYPGDHPEAQARAHPQAAFEALAEALDRMGAQS